MLYATVITKAPGLGIIDVQIYGPFPNIGKAQDWIVANVNPKDREAYIREAQYPS